MELDVRKDDLSGRCFIRQPTLLRAWRLERHHGPGSEPDWVREAGFYWLHPDTPRSQYSCRIPWENLAEYACSSQQTLFRDVEAWNTGAAIPEAVTPGHIIVGGWSRAWVVTPERFSEAYLPFGGFPA